MVLLMHFYTTARWCNSPHFPQDPCACYHNCYGLTLLSVRLQPQTVWSVEVKYLVCDPPESCAVCLDFISGIDLLDLFK